MTNHEFLKRIHKIVALKVCIKRDWRNAKRDKHQLVKSSQMCSESYSSESWFSSNILPHSISLNFHAFSPSQTRNFQYIFFPRRKHFLLKSQVYKFNWILPPSRSACKAFVTHFPFVREAHENSPRQTLETSLFIRSSLREKNSTWDWKENVLIKKLVNIWNLFSHFSWRNLNIE